MAPNYIGQHTTMLLRYINTFIHVSFYLREFKSSTVKIFSVVGGFGAGLGAGLGTGFGAGFGVGFCVGYGVAQLLTALTTMSRA